MHRGPSHPTRSDAQQPDTRSAPQEALSSRAAKADPLVSALFLLFPSRRQRARCIGRSSEQMLHATRKHVQAMPRGTWTRPRATWGALRAAARRQPRPPPPARAARPPRR